MKANTEETKQLRYYYNHHDDIIKSRKQQRDGWKEMGLCAKCGREVPEGQTVRLCAHHFAIYTDNLAPNRIKRAIKRDNTALGGRKLTEGKPWVGMKKVEKKVELP